MEEKADGEVCQCKEEFAKRLVYIDVWCEQVGSAGDMGELFSSSYYYRKQSYNKGV